MILIKTSIRYTFLILTSLLTMQFFLVLMSLFSTYLYAQTIFKADLSELSENGLGAELFLEKHKQNCDLRTIFYGETGIAKQVIRFKNNTQLWVNTKRYKYELGFYDTDIVKEILQENGHIQNTPLSNQLILENSKFTQSSQDFETYKDYIPQSILNQCR